MENLVCANFYSSRRNKIQQQKILKNKQTNKQQRNKRVIEST